MLQTLRIKNYAIIKETQINFTKGLNIITGETGAGKSILIGALGLILGNRADTKVLLQGEEKCVVEGHFNLKGYNLKQFFTLYELDYEELTILRREITASGKTRAFINDTPVTLNIIKELAEQLVDIVSQHQTLELNEEQFQLNVLDAIADTSKMLSDYQVNFLAYKKSEHYLNSLLEREAQARKDEDYIRFILNEFEEANLKPNEQLELETNLALLSNAEDIQNASANAANAIDSSEISLVDKLKELKTLLVQAAKNHLPLIELTKRLESNIIDLKDIAAELQSIAEQTQANPAELERIEERLQLIYNLQKKHRVETIEELIAIDEKYATDLNALGSLETEINNLKASMVSAHQNLTTQANELSKLRALAIVNIENTMQGLLQEVALPNAIFKIEQITLPLEKLNKNGLDTINFLFSANRGSLPLPINKVASGGELSRLMLCVKSLISNKIKLPTVIFDEIDTGISGDAAQKVAGVLQNHSKEHQVLAITHLPQIAGKANTHLFVYKQHTSNNTLTQIRELNQQERIEEIAHMLSGENPSESILLAAKELLAQQ